ncbi:hypothetical protein [Methylomonas sp. AM2-LC]|uniref:hypothetical protein n=1 Tax=Methylomonas sp. AM2-LC TaxID=3153301 RepID=UPI003262F7C5
MANLIDHAKYELTLAGYNLNQTEEDPDKWICENVLELLTIFANQLHSGFSAHFCIGLFSDLANYKLLTPATGEWREWTYVYSRTPDSGALKGLPIRVFQNKRISHVFLDEELGAYDLDGLIFREPNGSCYTNRESRVSIEFPYTAKSEYVDVPYSQDGYCETAAGLNPDFFVTLRT